MEKPLGCLLTLIILVVGIAVIFGIICLFAWLFQVLPPTVLWILGGLILIGANVVAFYESYVWGRRKTWYFPLCLIVSIVGVIVFISMLT